MMDRTRCLQVLNLRPGAGKEEIQKAYHDLVKVWHPDRFGHDPALALKAQEKLKEINEAHSALMRMPEEGASRARPSPGMRSDGPVRPYAGPHKHRPGLFHDSFFWFLFLVLLSLVLFGLGWSTFHGSFYKPHPGRSLQEIA